MFLVHGPRVGGVQRLTPSRAPDRCPDCGHVLAQLDTAGSVVARLVRSLRTDGTCHHADYEYSVLRDGFCGCPSPAHAGPALLGAPKRT